MCSGPCYFKSSNTQAVVHDQDAAMTRLTLRPSGQGTQRLEIECLHPGCSAALTGFAVEAERVVDLDSRGCVCTRPERTSHDPLTALPTRFRSFISSQCDLGDSTYWAGA